MSAPLAPIREEQTQESKKGIDKIKAITSGEQVAASSVDAAGSWHPVMLPAQVAPLIG